MNSYCIFVLRTFILFILAFGVSSLSVASVFVSESCQPYHIGGSSMTTNPDDFESQFQCEFTCFIVEWTGVGPLDCTAKFQQWACEDQCAGADSCPSTAGNPIDISSAEKIQTESDYLGVGAFPLEIKRYYGTDSLRPEGHYGQQWADHYERYIIVRRYGEDPDYTYQVTAYRPSGREIRFDGFLNPFNPATTESITFIEFGPGSGEWTLTLNNNQIETYQSALLLDQKEPLISIANPQGITQTLTYDVNNNLATVTDPEGHQLVYGYDLNEKIAAITDPDSQQYQYEYDANGYLETVTYPDDTVDTADNPQKNYLYERTDLPGFLTGIDDENGDRFATYGYDDVGRAILSEHAGGADRTEVSYDAGSTTVTNALGKESVFTYALINGIRKVENVEGVPSSTCAGGNQAYSYDTNGFKLSETDWNENLTTYVRDSQGLELSRTEASGTPEARTINTTWHPTFRLPSQIVAPGKTTDYIYDAAGRLLSRTETDTTTHTIPYSTNGQTRSWTNTYNALGLLVSVDGPRTDVSDVTSYTYDAQNNLINVSNPLGHETVIIARNSSGLPVILEDENQVQTTLVYNARNLVVSLIINASSGDVTTQFQYDNAQQITQILLPNGNQLNYQYDAAHRLTQVSNLLGERIEYALDPLGGRTSETIYSDTNAITRVQQRVFDELGRLIQDLGANGQDTAYTLDAMGSRLEINDGVNPTVTQAFDGLNRLIQATDSASQTTEYGYDDQGNLTTVTDPLDHSTEYTYDGFNRLIQILSPDTGTTVSTYDSAGNLVSQTDARDVVSNYSYDALNRITQKAFPADSSQTINYGYDDVSDGNNGIGKLTSITDVSGSSAFIYDDRGNLSQKTHTIQGTQYVDQYQYDLVNNLIQHTYPSGRIVYYSRDSLARVDSMTTQENGSAPLATVVSNLQYKPFGPLTAMTYGNGLESEFEYDLDYRIASLQTGDGIDNLQDRLYGYDTLNNIISISDGVDSARSQSYSYDELNRLTFASGIYGIASYSYDAVGNRLSRDISGGASDVAETYFYASTSNQLQSVDRQIDSNASTRTLSYTDNGNINGDDDGLGELRDLAYDQNNRLVSIDSNATPLASYLYNALGQRVAKTLGSEIRHFHYGLNGQLLSESDADGSPIRDFIYLDQLRLAMVLPSPAVIEADLSVAIDAVRNDATVDYSVTVTNAGPEDAENVILTNIQLASFDYDNYSADQGSCTPLDATTLECDFGTLIQDETATLTVTGTLTDPEATENLINAEATSSTADPDLNNNTAVWPGSGGCFIATAAYGSYEHDYLYVLRNFRDDILLSRASGQWFVAQYYQHSPPFAHWLGGQAWARSVVRVVLLPVIGTAWFIQQTSDIQALLLILSLIVVAGIKKAIMLGLTSPLKSGWWLLLAGILISLSLVSTGVKAEDLYFIHNDHLGTAQVITDKDQTVVWQGDYQPFGEVEETTAVIENPTRFPGQYFDQETGLHYNLMRDYDPVLGRYLQSDPIGLGGGINIYGYASQNPVRYYDPTGEYIWLLPILGGAAGLEGFLNLVGVIGYLILFNQIYGDAANDDTYEPDDGCIFWYEELLQVKRDLGGECPDEVLKKAINKSIEDYNTNCSTQGYPYLAPI